MTRPHTQGQRQLPLRNALSLSVDDIRGVG